MPPHQSRYWLNATPKDPEAFGAQVAEVCGLYAQASRLAEQGVHLVSTDEKTGRQALERPHPDIPPGPGRVPRREYAYQRHGTLCLTADLEVWCGGVIAPTLGPTRTEADFLAHVQQTVATDPAAGWVFIVDNLNPHRSESLVVWVAQVWGIAAGRGAKGKRGVLQSQASRAAFLSATGHRIRFGYTPKHTSWLNQVESWFSLLVRKLLRRASFTSVEDLRARVLAFIDYFNRTMAKPIRWLYSATPKPANGTG